MHLDIDLAIKGFSWAWLLLKNWFTKSAVDVKLLGKVSWWVCMDLLLSFILLSLWLRRAGLSAPVFGANISCEFLCTPALTAVLTDFHLEDGSSRYLYRVGGKKVCFFSFFGKQGGQVLRYKTQENLFQNFKLKPNVRCTEINKQNQV